MRAEARPGLGLIFRKYFGIAALGLKDKAFSFSRLAADTSLIYFRTGVLIYLYKVAFDHVGGWVNGVDLKIAAWSVAMYSVVLSFLARRIFFLINEDVSSGNVEVWLNKPVNYLAQKAIHQLAGGIPSGLATLGAAIIFLGIFVGFPDVTVTPVWAISVILITLLGVAISALIYILIGLAVFWTDNARPVYWIFDKAIMVLGGAYLPVVLFPDYLLYASKYSPFGAAMFLTHIFYENFVASWPMLVAIQLAWAIVLVFLVKFIYGRAKRRLVVSGG